MIKSIKYYVFALLVLVSSCSGRGNKIGVVINNKRFNFELSATSEQRKAGLMYRKELEKDGGMLFVFPGEMPLHFYMHNTIIPLDIAFINSNREIVDIKQMKPLDLTTISSSKPALMALEVNRGFFDRHKIQVGDKIELQQAVPYIVE